MWAKWDWAWCTPAGWCSCCCRCTAVSLPASTGWARRRSPPCPRSLDRARPRAAPYQALSDGAVLAAGLWAGLLWHGSGTVPLLRALALRPRWSALGCSPPVGRPRTTPPPGPMPDPAPSTTCGPASRSSPGSRGSGAVTAGERHAPTAGAESLSGWRQHADHAAAWVRPRPVGSRVRTSSAGSGCCVSSRPRVSWAATASPNSLSSRAQGASPARSSTAALARPWPGMQR